MKTSDIIKAAAIMKANQIKTSICIKCYEEFYIGYEDGIKEQRGVEFCDCGGELVISSE